MSRKRIHSLAAGLLLITFTAAAHAELYKWVDAQGKTHYSDKADGAGKAAVKELRVDQAPAAAPAKPASTPDWKKQEEQYRQRQAKLADAHPEGGGYAHVRQEGYRSGKLETDGNRCRLARDILSGAARHTGGAPTDANDREIATRDVGAFCH